MTGGSESVEANPIPFRVVRDAFLSYFRKIVCFQYHLQTKEAVTFVYVTQIEQTKGKSFWEKVMTNEIISAMFCQEQRLKLSYVHLHNITSGTKNDNPVRT